MPPSKCPPVLSCRATSPQHLIQNTSSQTCDESSQKLSAITPASQPVAHAPTASTQSTLRAHHEIYPEVIVAHLAFSTAIPMFPVFMFAFVVLTKVLDFLGDKLGVLLRRSGSSHRVAVDNGVGASDKTLFVPVRAGAGLPPGGTDVAKLGAA